MSELEEEFTVEESKKKGIKKSERTRRIKMALMDKLLKTDPATNKKFNALLDAEIETNPPPRPARKQRGHGRPHGGKVKFPKSKIDALPSIACMAHISKILGVRRASMQQWCDLEDNPLKFVTQSGHRLFRKDILVKWLIKTGRYEE